MPWPKVKGIQIHLPFATFLLLPIDVSSILGVYCVDLPIFIQKSVSVLNFLLFIFFKIRWECQSHVDSLHLHCFLEFPIDLVQGRLGCLLMVVVSNFHKTINRSYTVFVVALFLSFIFLFSATTITYSSMISSREM